jgi:hypothetical protein
MRARYAKGKKSQAIGDRSGFKVPYTSLKTTWDGLRVEPEDWEPKHPQLTPAKNVIDAVALFKPRPDNDPENAEFVVGYNYDIFADPRDRPGVGIHATGNVGFPDLVAVETAIIETGVAGTGAIGTLAAIIADAIFLETGLAGTGAIGTAIIETGVAGTGAIGTEAMESSITETGLAGTGAIGTDPNRRPRSQRLGWLAPAPSALRSRKPRSQRLESQALAPSALSLLSLTRSGAQALGALGLGATDELHDTRSQHQSIP